MTTSCSKSLPDNVVSGRWPWASFKPDSPGRTDPARRGNSSHDVGQPDDHEPDTEVRQHDRDQRSRRDREPIADEQQADRGGNPDEEDRRARDDAAPPGAETG